MMSEGAPMRIILSAAFLALAVATPATAAIRNFGITSFEKVRVDGPFKVRLSTGVAPFARASGSTAALDRVSIQIRGNTLVIQNHASSWGGYPGQESGPVEISVGTHDLFSAWVNGSGSLAIDRVKGLKFDLSVQGSGAADIDRVDIDQLSVNIVGTASAVLTGRAGKMTAFVRGVSSLDAAGLTTKDATIGAEGPATVKAEITNAVKIDGSGPATVTLAGRPSCTLRLHGSASVSGCNQ